MDNEIVSGNNEKIEVKVSENSLLVRQVAKIASNYGVAIGEKRLWSTLRNWGLIFKNSTEPMQKYMEKGFFEVDEGYIGTEYGRFAYKTTRVTDQGQFYIISRLIAENRKEKKF